ncbi:biotin synthase BioB [Bacillus sp. AFS018417]|uniref:biotin synthase BioB n=1 Tax=Bacillus TaxID=1386 RepID=UPI000BF80EF6|nr:MULTISPECIES: biotin synthase BioB [unclassified Bacillus (in: firmicutes)]MCP1125036.1 biotin synthase BioB [Bacillus sp. 3103sda1]PEZ02757.1 biotin synthase BioB [Bacillus sp. AFS018417]
MKHVQTKTNWKQIASEVVQGRAVTKEEAFNILQADDTEILEIMNAAYVIRNHYFGKKVKLNMIINTKSGLCPEDCGYCSQSIVSEAPIDKYAWLTQEKIVEGAHEAIRRKAGTYCIVASGRRPTNKEVEHVIGAVKEIRDTTDLKICCCLGFLNEDQAQRLAEAGVHRYNHNLNTHVDNYESICSTHTYDDRVDTVEKAKHAGISPCSGAIFGMGETKEQRVEIAFELKRIDADSIPCNFLVAVNGTPLEGQKELTPVECLKVLAMMRFVNPSKEIRISGGREINLRSVQPLGLFAANSIFVGDYLTTDGQEPTADWGMIEDLGFEIEECAL